MKKYGHRIVSYMPFGPFIKHLLMVKMTIMLVCLLSMQTFASKSKAQEKVSLNLKAISLKKALKKIENQTQLHFVYNDEMLPAESNISIDVDNEDWQDALQFILHDTKLGYKLLDGHLVVITNASSPKEIYQEIVSGKVVNEQNEPLVGVSVLEKGTSNATSTDERGEFRIRVSDKSAVLVFNYIGYVSVQDTVTGSPLSITMKADNLSLDDVVVVGYGTQKVTSLTGSVATIDADFLKDRPLTNASQALQGAQGVYVNQTGGQPGADGATIRIRGVGTLNNNNPLVLVDGIEYSLNDVNPNDIESISVLKDAASSAIYGNRAANGVVLITTKSGKKGRVQVDYNNYFGVQQVTYLPDAVTNSADWMVSRNQAAINEGQPPVFTDEQIEAFRTGSDPDLYPNTDWLDIMFRPAAMQEHNLRVSGGSEQVTYSLSLGYLDQDGVMVETDAKKYVLNSNIDFNITKNLKAGAKLSATHWNRNEPPVGVETMMSNSITRALPIDPNILSNGAYGDTWLTIPGHNVFRHPLALAENGVLNNKTQRALANIFAEYTFPFDIKYKANFAVQKFDGLTSRFIPEVYIYNPKEIDVPKVLRYDPPQRSAQREDVNNLSTTFFQTVDWTKTIADKHQVDLLLGMSRETFSNSGFNAYIEGFFGNELTELNAGTINKDLGGTSSESRLMSYFGRGNYSYADKYLFEVNFRYDGSSRFAKGKRWGFFPSFSVGWRIDQEAFMDSQDKVSNLKLRASWGQLGNQNVALYSYVNAVALGQGHSFNGNVVSGAAVTALSDPGISWETTTISNIGLDLGLWNNKLAVTADVFKKETTDILARINIPAQVGNLTGPVTNLYSMSNKGLELSVNYSNSINQLNYNIGANATYIDNVVDFLNGDIQYSNNDYGNINLIKEGYSVNAYYLYDAMGIFQTVEQVENHADQGPTTAPGDVMYRDVNEDGVIDGDDRIITGRSVPRYTYGFNLGLDIKGFDLSAFFQGVQDIDIYPIHNLSFPNFNGAGITKDQLANSWTPENPNAKYPRLTLPKRGTQANYQNSTFWLKDASYLRLKNLQLGYTLPQHIFDRIAVKKVRVFANAQNLVTFSSYKNSDPEKEILQGNIFDYPSTKIVSLGCNIIF